MERSWYQPPFLAFGDEIRWAKIYILYQRLIYLPPTRSTELSINPSVYLNKELLLAGQLLFQLPPQGVAWPKGGANHHHALCFALCGAMVHGNLGMRLAAAKRGLNLDDRIAAAAFQPRLDDIQLRPQTFGGEGFLEEDPRPPVFITAAIFEHFPQIGGEDLHGQEALQDVVVGDGNDMKGGHAFSPADSRVSVFALTCFICSI